MREKFKVAGAFLIGLSVASSVTFAQLGGRGRNVQFVDGATISPTSVVASGVSDQFVCSSTTSTCEISSSATSATTTINIPAIDIGPTATPSAQDKLVCFSYGPSGSKTRAACIDKEGDGFFSNISGNYINSDVASGSTAYNCTNTGCRLSLGNTGRYLVDDGTSLEFVAPVQATSFESLATSGSSFTGGNSSTSLTITSNTPDSVTSTTVPAIRLKASQDIADTDLLLSVEDSAGNRRLTLTEVGNNLVLPDTFGTFVSGSLGSFSNPNNTANISGNRSSDQFSIGVILRNATNLTTAGARLVAFRNATTDVASVDKDGLLRVNENNRAKPTCNATNRGRLFFLDGVTGGTPTADIMQVCMKDASDVYDWETVASP